MRVVAGILSALLCFACNTLDDEKRFGSIEQASAAYLVTAELIGRGTYPEYKVQSKDPVPYGARTKAETDIVVRRHTYQPGGYTGWHTHPGPVFITVMQGTVTFYEADDPSCTPHVVTAGQGYVDAGHGHYGVNESTELAIDVSVIMAPVGGAFRGEIDPPGNCPW